jgi:hypothetical protein
VISAQPEIRTDELIESYRRPLVTEWQEVVCAENPHEYYARKDTEVPRTDKPDF